MTAGPFALVRNPLYVGNFGIWIGLVLASGLLWMLPVAWLVFALQYSAITRFEEAALAARFGEAYLAYALAVPKWRPRRAGLPGALRDAGTQPWREVLFSERGTLIAAAGMSAAPRASAIAGCTEGDPHIADTLWPVWLPAPAAHVDAAVVHARRRADHRQRGVRHDRDLPLSRLPRRRQPAVPVDRVPAAAAGAGAATCSTATWRG